jgi:poly(3-hydroxybutyrate) depolymerase
VLAWQLAFSFERDAPKIYAAGGAFETSAWSDVGMRSPDLAAFRAHGGKAIVPHGVSDPVFSVLDTIAWWKEVDRRNKGRAADFARVFPVPGMNHCGGGQATDRFDSLTALENWVLKGSAPASILAVAGAETPWPRRARPLCAYPKVARYSGKGDINKAENFACKL